MKLIDSNILIYASRNEFSYLREYLQDSNNYYSSISLIEVLGFTGLTEIDKRFFDAVFHVLTPIPIGDEILSKAIALRQLKSMSIGDSIIGASALLLDLEIVTRNVTDFQWINGIRVVNPIR